MMFDSTQKACNFKSYFVESFAAKYEFFSLNIIAAIRLASTAQHFN